MRVKSGWAEFVDPRRHEVVARGIVHVLDPPLPCPALGRWEGDVSLLRGYDALHEGAGVWLLRFEDGAQLRWVEIEGVTPKWERSGLRGTARVVSYDNRFPSEVVELGGDG
jgi:hypothetical protein